MALVHIGKQVFGIDEQDLADSIGEQSGHEIRQVSIGSAGQDWTTVEDDSIVESAAFVAGKDSR